VTDDLRYPIGRFAFPQSTTPDQVQTWIREIEGHPAAFRRAVRDLTEARLDTPYRPDGWTVRQVAHHLPDSHMNAYVRFKLALTEDVPTIKPYEQQRWAELPDGKSGSIEVSLNLLEQLHTRWVRLLRAMRPADFDRRFKHPEQDGTLTLAGLTAMYAWHGKHHTAHVTELRRRNGW
jgi:hypothetical protein